VIPNAFKALEFEHIPYYFSYISLLALDRSVVGSLELPDSISTARTSVERYLWNFRTEAEIMELPARFNKARTY